MLEELEKILKRKNILTFKGKIDPGDNITAFCLFPDDIEKFVKIIEALDIKVIYIDAIEFNREMIDSIISSNIPKDGESFVINYLLNMYNKYFGLICELQIQFIYNNIVHVFRLSPEWYMEFKKVATDLISESEEHY